MMRNSVASILLLALSLPAQDAEDFARLNEMRRLFAEGRVAEAIPLAERILATTEKYKGPDDLTTAAVLNNLALMYTMEGAFEKAEATYLRALAIREKALGPEHADVAANLKNLGDLYRTKGEYEKAASLHERALAIDEKVLGPEHPGTADSLHTLAMVYHQQGAYPKAERLYLRALAIREKVLGPGDRDTAATLVNLAGLYWEQGDYPKAESAYLRVLPMFEKNAGPDNPRTATVLSNFGGLYEGMGEYAKAEPLLLRALAIEEKVKGPQHSSTALALNNLGALYRTQGLYAKAEPLFLRALAIHEKVFGPEHPNTGASVTNLANLYTLQGAYEKAEPLFLRALAIREKTSGPEHPDTANSLHNLAHFYRIQGEYAKAEPLYLRALAISEKASGTVHPHTAVTLDALAGLYASQGAYRKAEPLYQRALAIREKTLGPEHPDIANSLSNLAGLSRHQRDYAKAVLLETRALKIREKALGPDHPDVAFSLSSLAGMLRLRGDDQRAESLYQRALAIREKALGPEHPHTAGSLDDLASLYRSQRKYEKAAPLYARALAIQENALGPEHPDTLNIQQNIAILECARGQWGQAATRLQSLINSKRHRRDLAFGRESEKRAVLGVREALLSILYAGASVPEYRSTYLPLLLQVGLASKARLTDETGAEIESMRRRIDAADQSLLKDWQETGAQLSFLTQSGPGKRPLADFRKEVADLENKESDLAAQISSRSATLRKLSSDPTPQKVAEALQGRVLIEILSIDRFQPDQPIVYGDSVYVAVALFPDGRIDMAELGEVKDIDAIVLGYRRAQQAVDNREQADAIARKLGDAVFAPIARIAGTAKEWYLAPDGALRQIPLNALRLGDGKYVAESYKIWSLGSGRDLPSMDSRIESGFDDLVLANPDFGTGDGGFVPLPETEDEAESIAQALPNVQVIEEGNRSKQFLLALPNAPRILHLATHAFYRPGTGDPTLRSGIALNGANRGLDGILTAKAAQALRLRGTQLVVLSACETGVGEVSFGDGLIGLQRSLIVAGAKTQLLTQWKVNSGRTRDFMRRFYEKLAAGKSKGDAWLETQRDLIREGVAPHFWAPFVLYGDPGPLGER